MGKYRNGTEKTYILNFIRHPYITIPNPYELSDCFNNWNQ